MHVSCRRFLRVLLISVCVLTLFSILNSFLTTLSLVSLTTLHNDNGDHFAFDKKEMEEDLRNNIAQKMSSLSGGDILENGDEEEDEWILENENIPELSKILHPETNKKGPREYGKDCAKFPNLYKIRFSNVHWQIQETGHETYYFHSAYLDVRERRSVFWKGTEPKKNNTGVYVRILGMADALAINTDNSSLKVCQFWYEDQVQPKFGMVAAVRMLWNSAWGKTGLYYPYLISCILPDNIKPETTPFAVSLVTDACDNATNNLNILHQEQSAQLKIKVPPHPSPRFGVCVKALDFPDESMRYRLVEWIEMLRILGAQKIFFYEYFVDAEIKKVLNYYETQGFIEVVQTTLPGELPNQPQLRHLYIHGKKLDKRLTELIPYNDCLYRNMYEFTHLAVIDTDELILPTEHLTWPEMMTTIDEVDIGKKNVTENPISTYCFRNFYFLDESMTPERKEEVADIPEYFHMLRHIYRSRVHTTKRYLKCFHSTAVTQAVHNHLAFYCRQTGKPSKDVSWGCRRHFVEQERAQMNHYRGGCVADVKNCSDYATDVARDTKLWRYRNELVPRSMAVLNL